MNGKKARRLRKERELSGEPPPRKQIPGPVHISKGSFRERTINLRELPPREAIRASAQRTRAKELLRRAVRKHGEFDRRTNRFADGTTLKEARQRYG